MSWFICVCKWYSGWLAHSKKSTITFVLEIRLHHRYGAAIKFRNESYHTLKNKIFIRENEVPRKPVWRACQGNDFSNNSPTTIIFGHVDLDTRSNMTSTNYDESPNMPGNLIHRHQSVFDIYISYIYQSDSRIGRNCALALNINRDPTDKILVIYLKHLIVSSILLSDCFNMC